MNAIVKTIVGTASLGLLAACGAASHGAGATPPPAHPGAGLSGGGTAVSLARLQAALESGRPGSTPLGLGRVRALFVADGRDVVLLGEPARSPEESATADDLALMLRHAYGLAGGEPMGVSIDPRPGEEDPYAVQQTRVIGMPPSVLAARMIAADYLLKKSGAGIAPIPGVASVFERAGDPCADGAPRSITTRFWFVSDPPPQRPRFVRDGAFLEIAHPLRARVQAEKQIEDGSGRRLRGDAPDPEARAFAEAATRVMQGDPREPDLRGLARDYRLAEVAALVRHLGVGEDALAHLLRRHRVAEAEVPRFVVGINRSRIETVSCGGRVTEHDGGDKSVLAIRRELHQSQLQYRGGVELAAPPVASADVAAAPAGAFDALVRRVLAARPTDAPLFAWRFPAAPAAEVTP